MRTGQTFQSLASQLEDLRDNSKDFLVPVSKLEMDGDANLTFSNGSVKHYELNNWSHRQLATYVDIPQNYYERLRAQNKRLLSENVNHGLLRSPQTEQRMLRTHKGNIRAFVSSRYRRLDSFDLFEAVAPVMIQNGLTVQSCELTDQRMYLQTTTPRIQGEIKKGDVVQYGLTISSSDVGAGSVRVEPLLYRLVCLNGMISSTAIRKFHVGKNQTDDGNYELLTDSTKDLTDAAFWAQVRDVVAASMRQEVFQKEIARLQLAAEQKITNFDLPEVVELASRHVGVTNKSVKDNMLAYLANGADGAGLTKWGLANAFTFAANQDSVSYDDAVELERIGSKIIDLTKNQWSEIAEKGAAA